jgi:glycosyltransferase involved in cell wall biosynthesis
MRILIWHGYLLGGTGSNVYTRQLAREWSLNGHEVTVLCQDPHPERADVGSAEVARPDVGRLLPVFVLDEYDGYDPKLLQDCSRDELDRWVEANATAVRERLPADLVYYNHVLLGGAVGAAAGTPYVLKAHGSELEYSMRGRPELEEWGRAVLAGAHAVVVGSGHIKDVLGEVCGYDGPVHEIPPGVDVETWLPQPREEALEALIAEARRDRPNPGNANERLPDEGNADRLGAFLAGEAPTVVYFGKLLYNKGVHLLLEALAGLDARAVVVGFGDYREELERMADPAKTLFTGPLEHRHLVHLLALADACVVPSIFPEAFGMVAAEAAAAGCPPVVARHSGLAEIAEGLDAEYPPELRGLSSFANGDVAELRKKVGRLLGLSPGEREAVRAAARRAAVERWSWSGVAERLLALRP